MRNLFKKMILTTALIIGTLVVLPTTTQAKTKTLTYNINKVSADKFCEDVQAQGKEAIFAGGKDKYKIVLTVKASSKKDGRAKVKAYAKKVMNADSNKFGLSYGIKMDEYNHESYDTKKKVYTTKLFNTANDIYYLNAITSKALRDVDFWQEHWVNNIIAMFPNNESFKDLSQSAKAEFILKYMGINCMQGNYDLYLKGTGGGIFSWKKAYKGEMEGVCSDYANMYLLASRLVAYDYDAQIEVNTKANHAVILVGAKNSKGDYDYFEGNNGAFGAYNYLNTDAIKFCKSNKQAGTLLGDWQVKDAKNYRVTKLEKAAYKYCTANKKSDLEKMGIY